MPKLSIITVNLNNGKGLQKTIESVITQTFTHYEYIIIDGGSTDGSKEIIEKYTDKITYWVSEPDKGVYNGMNKGIKVAKGEYCLFLNSGDWLIGDEVLQQAFDFKFTEDVVYGNLKSIEDYIYPDKIKLSTFFFASLGHPASFIKIKLFEKYGLYNEKNKIVSDWEFFIKALVVNSCSYKHIPIFVSYYEQGGVSTSEKMNKIHFQEREEILKSLFPMMYDDYIEMKKNKNELKHYKNSRLIKLAKKVQQSKLYKIITRK